MNSNIQPLLSPETDVVAGCDNKIVEDKPDAHIMLNDAKGRLVARCSVWWNLDVEIEGAKVGFIGHFAASGAAWAHEILNKACSLLADNGTQVAVGPVDGSTWKRYRFITSRGNEPIYFLEPNNPDVYPLYYLDSGFSTLTDYYSTICDSLTPSPKTYKLPDGLNVRPIDTNNIESELDKLYEVSLKSFANNFLYQPISREKFHAMYAPLVRFINPELVLIAEDNGEACGFILALPDPSASIPTIIVKTAARIPGRRYAGLGRHLLESVHNRAYELGFSRAIQALMHETNSSLSISKSYGRIIRRYSLFARTLT